MALPKLGMAVFPSEMWDGLTSEIMHSEQSRQAGPVTTRKLIDEMVALQYYLSQKYLDLPAFNPDESDPALTIIDPKLVLMSNMARLNIGSFTKAAQGALHVTWDIDLRPYLAGIGKIFGNAPFDISSGPTMATLTYIHTIKRFTLDIANAKAFAQRELSIQVTMA
jgi:hypothetical protein